MLAMPLAAAGVGFTVTLGLLFTLWALMCYTALLLLEVYQHVPCRYGARFSGGALSGPLWAVGYRILHAVSAVHPHGSLYQWRR
ncbi:hypothetical protein LNQ52_20615 [Klebsiella pneumoniae subsp. pneumoniae]|nr:hypothetical protein [Klebsiella pneumoniae subsp. pneumoniae]